MSFKYPTLAAALILGFVSPALAQNNTTSYYSPNQIGTTPNVPIYNTTGTPLAIDQMVAGKNAPSYTYNNSRQQQQQQIQPYTFNQGTTGASPYTGQQVGSPSQQYLEALARQQVMAQNSGQNGATPYNNAYNNQSNSNIYNNLQNLNAGPFGNQVQNEGQRKRRVVYKEMNNPLKEPTRLFNPDQ